MIFSHLKIELNYFNFYIDKQKIICYSDARGDNNDKSNIHLPRLSR